MKINFTFFGTPEISRKTLDILKENNYLPSLIITNPDAKSGRGMKLKSSPVAIWAEKNNIPCLKELDINKIETDLIIVVAYGKIIPKKMIDKFNIINVHYSLLPKYRGASPVEQALLNGDKYTGVSIQKMKFKLDSGPIIAKEKIEIDPDETKIDLLNKLVKIGGKLLVKILPNIDEIKAEKQDENKISFTRKLKKEDGFINLNDNPIKNYNKYRAFTGWPGTYYFKEGIRNKIVKAKLENNKFIIEKIIPAGKKEISI